VISGVPQGSVLGPLLFLLYVNDLTDWIKNSINMFADDTKIWYLITSEADSYLLQDLNSLELWSKKWLLAYLQLHTEKYKVMHMWYSYQTIYTMGKHGTAKSRRVYTTSDLKSSTQCNKAANKAMSVLRMANTAFRRMDKEQLLVIRTRILCTELKPTLCQR